MCKNQLPKTLLNHESFQRGKLIVVHHFRTRQSLCYLPLFVEFLIIGGEVIGSCSRTPVLSLKKNLPANTG